MNGLHKFVPDNMPHLISAAAIVGFMGLLFQAEICQAQSPVPEDEVVESVADGFQFTEGPFWRMDEGDLLFSDIPANTIYKWQPNGETETFLKPSGHSNGITVDPQGRLVLAQHDRKVSRLDEEGNLTVLVDLYNGKKLNKPNDIVVHSTGAIYFTDPTFGMNEEDKELGFTGVYRIGTDGSIQLLTKEQQLPNGLAFSPDESVLYINDSATNKVYAYPVKEDGTLGEGAVLATMKDDEHKGGADGMKVDSEGNIYTAGPGGVWIYSPEGKLVDRIMVPAQTTNMAWGGSDFRTLYITTPAEIYRIRLNIKGDRVDMK